MWVMHAVCRYTAGPQEGEGLSLHLVGRGKRRVSRSNPCSKVLKSGDEMSRGRWGRSIKGRTSSNRQSSEWGWGSEEK